MSKRLCRLICMSTCLVLIAFELSAQQSYLNSSSEQAWREGLELFENENYGAAHHAFSQVIEDDEYSCRSGQAQYYRACCAIELFRPDAEHQMKAFIREHPESPLLHDAYFQLGRHQYRNKKFRAAQVWFQQVEPYSLKGDSKVEYLFKTGYCYLKSGDNQKAASAFYEIKDVAGKYNGPANYYYSHIAYLNKNYQVAFNGFEKLNDDKTFAPIVPYYICQIYYLQGKYEDVLEYAPKYLEKASTKRIPEIARIIGQSHFRMFEYKKAIPYLERFQSQGEGMKREDKFELGYCYYKLNEYGKAVKLLESTGGKEDALTQNANYCLADCYLHLDQKKRAKAAFAATARMDFDVDMQQDALFNFAKITYELSYSPFNETIKAFDEYLLKYPQSERNDQAYDYLVKVYMTTRNYQDALVSMDKIRRKTPAIQEAYQRVAYLRGLEVFKQLEYEEAVNLMKKSLEFRHYNKNITAASLYWSAEAYYRLEKYNRAKELFQEFLYTPGASRTQWYDRTYYNLGYVCFKQGDYKEACDWFRKYENQQKNNDSKLLTDARNRIGDYYFLKRDYSLAVNYYQQAIESGNWDTDYSLYQKGFALGLMGQYLKKVDQLQIIVDRYEQSSYCDDALYQMGKAWVMADKEDNAINCYSQLIEQYPSSNYNSRAALQLGLLNYNAKNYDAALKAYKRVVTQFPGTPDAQSAMTGLKNVYVDMNRVEEYFAYAKSLGDGKQIKTSERDSLTYLSAEKLYMAGRFTDASAAFDRYKNRFSDGHFLLNANFYKAQCDLNEGDDDAALKGFHYVLDQPRNLFTEQALRAASELNFRKSDYVKAGEQFQQLEEMAQIPSNIETARIGKMRCSYLLNRYEECVAQSRKVLDTHKVGEEIIREARYYRAKSLLALGQKKQALEAFDVLARETKSVEGAEAKYQVANILYCMNRIDDAEKEINSFIEMNSPHQYWLAESFILLSKVYLQQKDNFQARYTLQSIVDNYGGDNDGIVQRAQIKLDSLLSVEKASMDSVAVKEVKINFHQSNETSQQELFEEDENTRDTLGLDEARMMLEEMLKNEKEND